MGVERVAPFALVGERLLADDATGCPGRDGARAGRVVKKCAVGAAALFDLGGRLRLQQLYCMPVADDVLWLLQDAIPEFSVF